MVDTVGEKKYQHLSYVEKAALTLSHSNASPERRFSVNNALVMTDRGSLSARSIFMGGAPIGAGGHDPSLFIGVARIFRGWVCPGVDPGFLVGVRWRGKAR